jgi:hypothetical protein
VKLARILRRRGTLVVATVTAALVGCDGHAVTPILPDASLDGAADAASVDVGSSAAHAVDATVGIDVEAPP